MEQEEVFLKISPFKTIHQIHKILEQEKPSIFHNKKIHPYDLRNRKPYIQILNKSLDFRNSKINA